jgi:hypothetical protein
MRLRHLVPLVAIALFAGPASAAGLGGSGDIALGSDASAIGSCDHDGVRSDFVLDGDRVTAVSVSGLSGGCAGQTVEVTVSLENETTARGSGGARPGGTEIVLSQRVAASDVSDVSVVVAG